MTINDELLGLRNITVHFFEEGMASLFVLKKEMDIFPDNPEVRQRWVNEVHAFSGRAQDLSEKWDRLFPRAKEARATKAEHPSHEETLTPRI